MRRLISLRVVLLGGLALLAGVAAVSDACFRCRRCCVVYVQLPGDGGTPPPVSAESQKIRALIIVDDNDKRKGWSTAVWSDAGLVNGLLSPRTGMVATTTVLSRQDVTRDSILDYIRMMPVGSKDTLFVYYNGHGAQDQDPERQKDPSKGHYFDLVLGKAAGGPRLYREEVLAAMNTHQCRLKVLITDSCFAVAKPKKEQVDNLTPLSTKFDVESETVAEPQDLSILSHLFLEQEGIVNINSCDVDELAISEVFTPIMVDKMKKWDGPTRTPTWQEYFDSIKKKTVAKAKEMIEAGDVPQLGDGPQKTQTPLAFAIGTGYFIDATPPSQLKSEEGIGAGVAEGISLLGDDDAPERTLADARESPATLQVRLPEEARLFIDGTPTQQASALRTFQTPALTPGLDYTYTLRAELTVDGVANQVTRQVWVRAGRTTSVDLADAELFRPAAAATATARAAPAPSGESTQP